MGGKGGGGGKKWCESGGGWECMSKVPVFPGAAQPWPARLPTSPLYLHTLQCVGQRIPPGPVTPRALPDVPLPDLASPTDDCTLWRVSRKG